MLLSAIGSPLQTLVGFAVLGRPIITVWSKLARSMLMGQIARWARQGFILEGQRYRGTEKGLGDDFRCGVLFSEFRMP
jgi:hypothetical protein